MIKTSLTMKIGMILFKFMTIKYFLCTTRIMFDYRQIHYWKIKFQQAHFIR